MTVLDAYYAFNFDIVRNHHARMWVGRFYLKNVVPLPSCVYDGYRLTSMTVLDVYDCFGLVQWFWMCMTVFSINSHLRSERRRTLCFLRFSMFDKKEVTFLVQKF